jgi:hypothetical protein
LIEANGSYVRREYSNASEFEFWNYDSQNLETYRFRQEGLNYTQYIYRVYGRYNYRRKNYSVNFRLSAEQMINKGVFLSTENSKLDYNEINIFPSLRVLYRTKHGYSIAAGYNTRTLRPNINYLNPFKDDSDPKNIMMGNPELRAEYAHNFNLSVRKFFGNNLIVELLSSAEYINNAIERITTIDNQNISTTTYENISNKEDYFAQISFMMIPLSRFSFYSLGMLYHTKYTNTVTGMKNNMTGFGYSGNFSVTLFKSTRFGGSVNVSPQMSSVQTQKVNYYHSFRFSLSQTLVKDKLFLTLSLNEPFSRHRYISNTIGDNLFHMTTKKEVLGRLFGFSLRWNFGHLKDNSFIHDSESIPSDLSRPELPVR